MEYDNDRLRRHTPKLEIFYWVLLVLLNPLANSIAAFSRSPLMWPLLLLVNLILLPAYIAYSRIIGLIMPSKSRKIYLILVTILSLIVIQSFLLAVDSLILQFPLSPAERAYFAFGPATMTREVWWMIVTLAFSAAIYFVRKSGEDKDALAALQKENTFFKLRYLRAQLNPHFLFNTLNSIYSLSLQKSDRTPEVVVRLADIMRYLIYECNEEKIPLDKEIEFIRNYIEIEKIRHKADIQLTVEGQTAGVTIEPYLFISFIENGFKHAMDHSFDEPFIYITLKSANGQLVLNVINSTASDLEIQAGRINGKGIAHSRSLLELLYPASYDLDIIQTEKDETRTSALRLRNARERLETLYPDSHTLDVILSKSSFTVSLILKTVAAC